MEKLAEAVKLAANLHEYSYNQEDFKYKLKLEEATDQAAEQCGFDKRGNLPIYLLLKYCWNDILDWAEQYK